MMARAGQACAVVALFVALTVLMTWPQTQHLGTHVADAEDPLLSIWRISWIAHALPRHPLDLFNGNIFYPEKRTLAFTDSVLIQGLAGAPLLWMGVPAVAVYNLLLLGSIALSGAAMWLYAFQVTGSPYAAVLAGIVFAFVPFRFDHLQHLELQATVFLPLTLWWLERAVDSGRPRDIYGMAGALAAQVYCGIYFAIFLVSALVIVVPLRLAALAPDRRRTLVGALARALPIAGLIVAPYLAVYVMNRDALGDRVATDVLRYSATPGNYLATPEGNLMYGRWSGALGQNERRLFPGMLAVALAAVGLAARDRRRAPLAIVGLTGLIVSLGIHTPVYDVLRTAVFTYRGLRAPARAAILVYLALAALVAVGWARLQPKLGRWTLAATVAVGSLMLLEYITVADSWLILPRQSPSVYRWLARQPRSVIVELPLPTADRLDLIYEGFYMLWSTEHWDPMLNGYSGFFPRSFLELTEVAKTFPDDRTVSYLKSRQVDIVILHGGYMKPERFAEVTAALVSRPDMTMLAQFNEPRGQDIVFRLRR